MNIDRTPLPDENVLRERLRLQEPQFKAKKDEISELVKTLPKDQRLVVDLYMNAPYKQTPEKYLKHNAAHGEPIKNEALLGELNKLHLMSLDLRPLHESANMINDRRNIITEIATLDSLLDLSGDRAKYEPAHQAILDNDAKLKKIKEALVQHEEKTFKLTKCMENSKDILAKFLGNEDQKIAIATMGSLHQHGDDQEFKAYLKALFDQKQGNLSAKIAHAYEVMDKDLRALNAMTPELKSLQTALATENKELRAGIKQAPNPALNDKFTKVTDALGVAATARAAPPAPEAASAAAGAATPPNQPGYRLSGDDKRGITMEHTNGIGRKPTAHQHAAFLAEAERIIGKGKEFDDLKSTITFDANDEVIKIAAANGTRENPKIGAYAQANVTKALAINFKTQGITEDQAHQLSAAFATTTGLSARTL